MFADSRATIMVAQVFFFCFIIQYISEKENIPVDASSKSFMLA